MDWLWGEGGGGEGDAFFFDFREVNVYKFPLRKKVVSSLWNKNDGRVSVNMKGVDLLDFGRQEKQRKIHFRRGFRAKGF